MNPEVAAFVAGVIIGVFTTFPFGRAIGRLDREFKKYGL